MIVNNIFKKAADAWRDNKGIGTALVPHPIDPRAFVYTILSKLYGSNTNKTTLIITEDFRQRTDVIEFLTHQQDEENNQEFRRLLDSRQIMVYTSSYVISNVWAFGATCTIWYCPVNLLYPIKINLTTSKFRLVILNKLITDANESAELYKIAPFMSCFGQAEVDAIRLNSPVEETWVGVDVDKDSMAWQVYEYSSKYIETSLAIFGSFDVMQKARTGDNSINTSSAAICTQLAYENGWSEHLDMSYDFNKTIDDLYNPAALRSRATQTYEEIRKRNSVITDYEGKLKVLHDLIKQCDGDKILIINKRGEFANKVTDYLNNHSEIDICGNYHNKVYDIEAVDVNGNPIYVKSGKEKGKRKVMSFRAQMTLNENRFNLDKITCLSLSNTPDKTLNVDVDTVIITSPLCENIESYLYRLNGLRIKGKKLKLFTLFCRNTIEESRLLNKDVNENHSILNKDEILANIGNNFDFFIAD